MRGIPRLGNLACLIACAVGLLATKPCDAASADSSATLYSLKSPPSALEIGCEGPCACALQTQPTFGSFELVRTSVGPLYTEYAVERFIASFNNGPGAVALVGSGHYRIGGEVALMNQLTLDLSIEGHPPVHFDSGLQPLRVPFPQIDLSAAVHAFACFDTVLIVDAFPGNSAGTGVPPLAPSGLRSVQPNPFRGRTLITFTADGRGAMQLEVLDATGRRVRQLRSGGVPAAGMQSVEWDGRSDDGRKAPAGTYWVRMQQPGRADSRRFVKLD